MMENIIGKILTQLGGLASTLPKGKLALNDGTVVKAYTNNKKEKGWWGITTNTLHQKNIDFFIFTYGYDAFFLIPFAVIKELDNSNCFSKAENGRRHIHITGGDFDRWYIDGGNNVGEYYKKIVNIICGAIEAIKDDDLTSTIMAQSKEGRKIEIYTTKYERSANNRNACIRIHGTKCKVCSFDFYEYYGEIGKDFVEVHHIKPLYELEDEVTINPAEDLVPLCSNCHRMIHRKKDKIVCIEELKEIILKKQI